VAPASEPTPGVAAGQPFGSQVQVNSLVAAHWSGSVTHAPAVRVKHQPHPATGVHEPHVV